MHRRNTIIGALFSIALFAGVAWYGERTHWIRPHAPPPDKVIVFPLPTVDPEPTEIPDGKKEDARKEEVAAPALPDTPQPKLPDKFAQPIEPPRPDVVIQDTAKIPAFGSTGGISAQSFDPSQLDQQAVPKFQAKPEYPYSLKQQGLSGEVVVSFIVDANGDVRNAVAIRSSQSGFEASACKAVSRWKFKPGRKGGRAVSVRMEVPIVFSIDKAD